jgi:hypothetical protein
MDRESAERHIEEEFKRAEAARQAGNDGMVRVCARRAAGIAAEFWLERNPREGWGTDAITRLRATANAADIPAEIRAGAARLSARVTPRFTSPHDTDPLKDARELISFFLQP